MKKGIFKTITLATLCLSMASCGMGTSGSSTSANLGGTASTGTHANGSLAGGLLGSALTGNTGGAGQLLNVLTGLLGTKTSESSLVGTWTYSAPKVVFESESIMAKLGGAVVSNKVESTLGKHLKKMGMIAGKSHLTLNKDKTCTFTYKTKSYNGTYTYDTNTSTLTITGALGVSTMTCTATVSGNELHMLFDADKLLNVMTGLGSSLTTNATLSTLLKSYNGMMLGWTMTR